MKADADKISTVKHPAIASARKAIARSGRESPRSFLVDGHRMVRQALDAGADIEGVFLLDPIESAEDTQLLGAAEERGIACHPTAKGVFFKLLGLGYETSVRSLAIVRRTPLAPPDVAALVGDEACFLVGETIQDPRNVGVLIRTADAYGLTAAVFTRDSADPYARASVRSTTGSIFRASVGETPDVQDCLTRLKDRAVRIVGTSAAAAHTCWDTDLSGPCAIVLGNESSGLSADAKGLCDEMVTIPMYGGAHSLNVTVAAGILLYEVAKQRAK